MIWLLISFGLKVIGISFSAKDILKVKEKISIRYKTGKNLNFNEKEVFYIKNPEEAYLPKSNLSSSYVFAKEDYYFCYPNNYNHFVNYYRNTFQHGGVSIEEVIVPVAVFESKN